MDYNTIIIGSGVAGMTAAIYLKRANISVCIIESDAPGGQILRTAEINNYPGFEKIEGPELAINMYNQVSKLGVPYLFTKVINITVDNDIKIIKTSQQAELKCKNVIIATGRSPRKLEVENEEKLIGRGISYCAICDGNLYKDKNIIVVGGGRAALEETLYLSKICSNITLIHRRDSFRTDDTLVERVKSVSNITIKTNMIVDKFIEVDGKFAGVSIKEKDTLETININADGCFIYIGEIPNTDSFKELITLNENNYIKVDNNYETNIKEIYAVGDCIEKELYQVVTACGDAAIAANRIIKNK